MIIDRRLRGPALATALLAMFAGCATSTIGESTSSVPGPKSGAGFLTAAQCSPEVDPEKNGSICYVVVTPAPSGRVCGDAHVTVGPDQLTVKPSSMGRKRLTVRFQFSDESAGYRFCPVLGDGMFLKHPAKFKHKQFMHPYATDGEGEDNNPSGDERDQEGCYKRFRVDFLNKVGSGVPANVEYEYVLNFRQIDVNNNTVVACRKDPWIKNGQ